MATSAERQRKYRMNLKENDKKRIMRLTISKDTVAIIDAHIGTAGNTRAAVIETAISAWGKL